MTQTLRLRRGSTADHSTFIGKEAELTYDTDEKIPRIHDGVTVGGRPLVADESGVGGLGVVRGDGIVKIQALFQRDYDAIDFPDPMTLYIIIPMKISCDTGDFFYFGNDAEMIHS